MKSLTKYFNPTHITAGFVAVLVGYTSSAAIIFQAAQKAGASEAVISSWLWALGVGMAATSIGFSIKYKQPVLTAWSTPGAALLVTSVSGYSLNEAIGIFIFSSVLITISGMTGIFDRIIKWIPPSVASAMLAGILFKFGLDVFLKLGSDSELVLIMLLSYLIFKRLLPRYNIPLVLIIGFCICLVRNQIQLDMIRFEPTIPIFIKPSFNISTLMSLGIPLFIVTMASQNLPGISTLRANNYDAPASPIITWTGITGIILAPFGGIAFSLAAITAAICMGDEAGKDRSRRYLASVWAGVFYLMTGVFGATITLLFTAIPGVLVSVIAGLALFATIGNSLATAMSENSHRDAALIAFLVTVSGLELLGVGSAFWGLVFGTVALVISQLSKTK